MTVALAALVLIWLGFIAYVVLGGADFGAGVWDLLASGPTARRQHQFISKVLGPVWEANHVWLIFLLVGLMNIFSGAFAIFMGALFVPLMLALLGIVLRGAGFIFRTHPLQDKDLLTRLWNRRFSAHALQNEDLFTRLWSRLFSLSSLLTPFFLGAAAAAVAGGQVHASGASSEDLLVGWISPFSLAVGVMAILQCATLAAVYLAAEARAIHEDNFAASYRLKALVSGALVSILGIVCISLSLGQAPWLWQGLLAHAWPYAIAAILSGSLVLLTLVQHKYRLAGFFVILETTLMLFSWGIAQYPYILPPTLTIEQAANAPQVVTTLLIVMIIGMLIVIPSLLFLFRVFKWSPAAVISGSRAQEKESI